MKLPRVLRWGAMGRRPSPSPRIEQKQASLEQVAAALSKLADPTPMSQEQISRIQARIFELAFDDPLPPSDPGVGPPAANSRGHLRDSKPCIEGPVSPDVFRRNFRGTTTNASLSIGNGRGGFQMVGEISPLMVANPIDLTAGNEVDDIDESLWELPEPNFESGDGRNLFRSRLSRSLIAALAALALLTGTAIASTHASPGNLLYPLKLQIELLRITAARTPEAKANTYITIAFDRIMELSSMDRGTPADLALVTGEMDSAGLAALQLLRPHSGSHERTDLLGKLLSLAVSEQRILERMLAVANPVAVGAISRSYSTASLIAGETKKLLRPTGTIPIEATANAPVRQSAPGTERISTNRRVSIAKGSLKNSSVSNQSPSNSTQPDNPDETTGGGGCDVTQVEICIALPIHLPL